ncbi:uncharacterized protein [Palaemon carinicauda]|uniref:uncharacterized protein n=1 Tax=Palaemon carinicauda TaxID=392227 RepID=UPI0035B5E7F3
MKIADDFSTSLYDSNIRNNFTNRNNETPEPVLNVTVGKVKRAFKCMNKGKEAAEDGLTIDLIIDGGYFVVEKFAELFTECLQECSIPTSWKNFSIILIQKQGTKDLKNYR